MLHKCFFHLHKYYFFSFFLYIIVLRCICMSQLKSITYLLGPRFIILTKQLLRNYSVYNQFSITAFKLYFSVLFYYFSYNIIMQMHFLE